MKKSLIYFYFLIIFSTGHSISQELQVIRPKEIDDILINPGIGFMTFQRFNGDTLNAFAAHNGSDWTEGYPIEFQEFDGNLKNQDYPQTSIAYFRVYWKFLEPEMDKYNWELIDNAILTAAERGQTLMLRIAPYGRDQDQDIPDWLRKIVGKSENLKHDYWVVDPEDKNYVKHFTNLIRDLGARYDGHPSLESVDMAVVGFWGEGAGSELLTETTRSALVDAYLDSFTKTYLIMLLTDPETNGYALTKRNIGWRVDCLGDLGFWKKPGKEHYWCHMFDLYPQDIIRCGMQNAWIKAPISFEACGVLNDWLKRGFDIDYIIEQSLKWHISSFNAKSSPVPKPWAAKVNDWLKKMGYRFVLRRFECPQVLEPNRRLAFKTWWENKGVAPCYRQYPLALRLKNDSFSALFLLDADLREWLPGDVLYEDAIFVPQATPPGIYDLDVAIIDKNTGRPKIRLAIAGMTEDGWYKITTIEVVRRKVY